MAIEKSPTALKTIGEVAKELGVATHVLRFWETKFSQIKPQKRRGRRYYRPEDVKVITQIKSLLYSQGYTIKGVKKFLASGNKAKKEIAEKTEKAEVKQIQKQESDDLDLFGFIEKVEKEERYDHVLTSLKAVHKNLCSLRDEIEELSKAA